jgi:PAS domain S-box-containing protein
MTVVNKAAPALARLLEDSALSRAVFGACRVPLALVDAGRRVAWVNPAFEDCFGWKQAESLGRALSALLFRGDEGLAQRLCADSGSPWVLDAWAKDGRPKHVEVALGAIRRVDGQLTHWVLSFAELRDFQPLLEPAGRAQQPRIEAAAPHELHA